jgi:hypothetical protein
MDVAVDAASNTLSIGSAMAKRRTVGYCANSLKAPRPSILGWHRRYREFFKISFYPSTLANQ